MRCPRSTQHSLVQNTGPGITYWSCHCSECMWERSHSTNRRTPQTLASLIQIKHKNKWLSFYWNISGVSTKIHTCVQHSPHSFLWINQCWNTVYFQLAPLQCHLYLDGASNTTCTFPSWEAALPPLTADQTFPPNGNSSNNGEAHSMAPGIWRQSVHPKWQFLLTLCVHVYVIKYIYYIYYIFVII